MTTIQMGKQYRTRDGREVRIYCTDAGGSWPVHGSYYVESESRWAHVTWDINGFFDTPDEENNRDLIEVPERVSRWHDWVHYRLGYDTRAGAEASARANGQPASIVEIIFEGQRAVDVKLHPVEAK